MLRASTFADQLCACTIDGSCFVANDSPFAFTGTVTVRVLNVISGASNTIVSRSLSLPPGPRVTRWFCGTGNRSDDAITPMDTSDKNTLGIATYALHRRQIPDPSANFTKELQATSEAACEAACNTEPACLGFTSMPSLQLTTCWLYSSAPRLQDDQAWWWQKPGTAHIPAPPPPPMPPPLPGPAPGPPLLKCADWNATALWKAVGCAVDGANCVLDIRVNRSSGEVASWSTVPFTAPKDMTLPASSVSITVMDKPPPRAETVEIVLTTTATALYVVLTTQAAGRFSDNVLLLEAGEPRSLRFLAWGELDYDLFKSSVRVEHLAENLANAPLKSDDGVSTATVSEALVSLCPNASRELPLMGFGTELVWHDATDQRLAASAATAGSRLLRYPRGTPSNFWDWSCENQACCTAESLAESRCEDHGYPKVPPETWATFARNSGSPPTIFDLNVVQTNASYQLEGLRRFAAAGVPVQMIEFGNELYDPGQNRGVWKDGGGYAEAIAPYLQVMAEAFPAAQTAVVVSDENRQWNQDVLADTPATAATIHFYMPLMTRGLTNSNVAARAALLLASVVNAPNPSMPSPRPRSHRDCISGSQNLVTWGPMAGRQRSSTEHGSRGSTLAQQPCYCCGRRESMSQCCTTCYVATPMPLRLQLAHSGDRLHRRT